jgi:precorrin-6x reductase
MADDLSRVELGFDSGLIVITKLEGGEWAKLEAALEAGKGVVRLAAPDDTTYHVDVSKVDYVKREAHVGRVGF